MSSPTVQEDRLTRTARKRYDRRAPLYDLIEALAERGSFKKWRPLLWSKVEGKRILEVGVGTGKNMPYYPKDAEITAIDFSEKMLERARMRARDLGADVKLLQMDVQRLQFEESTFDCVVDSFVFCSVPDPVRGLEEIRRVLKPGGKLVMLEHVVSANAILAWLMNLANPIVVRMMGANINRRTVENVGRSELTIERVTDLSSIFKLIEARKNP